MTTDRNPTASESARALLDRHGLPEDVIDGVLALHAQELAAVQRQAHDASGYHMGQVCKPEYECGVRATIDLIDPTRPAAVPVPPPADQTALRQRIAEAVRRVPIKYGAGPDAYTIQPVSIEEADVIAAAVVAVLPPEDRGAALRESADVAVRAARGCGDSEAGQYAASVAAGIGKELRRMADAAAVLSVLPEQADRAAEAERPLSPDYEHPACGFHWHGRDGMDIPIRDGQPVCPRCELAKAEKKLAYVQRMRDEVGAECKRRGRIKLEQAERIVRLERELDGVRDQLGKEMLRADDAEAELRRLAAEEQPAAGCWCGHPQDRHWAGSTRMTFPDGCHDCRGWNGAHVYGQELPWADDKPDAEWPAVGEQPETQETPVLRCNWAHTLHEHTPHRWEPQPGMDPVHCPGFSRTPE